MAPVQAAAVAPEGKKSQTAEFTKGEASKEDSQMDMNMINGST